MKYPFPEKVDNTALKGFRQCEKYGHYNIFRKIVSTKESIHLHAGAAFARGLEIYRQAVYDFDIPKDYALELGIRALVETYGDFTVPFPTPKTVDRLVSALVYYAERYPTDGVIRPYRINGKAAVEFTLAVPIPDFLHPVTNQPIIYTGRFDMLGLFNGEQIAIVDEKTTTQLGKSWVDQWPLASQFMGYSWGLKELGYEADLALIRGISILKNGHDTLEEPVYIQDWRREVWYENTIQTLLRMKAAWESDFFLQDFGVSCNAHHSRCSYYELCDSRDPEPFIPVNFKPNTWTPLKSLTSNSAGSLTSCTKSPEPVQTIQNLRDQL